MASLSYNYDELIAPGSYTTVSGTASTQLSSRAIDEMHYEMDRMRKEHEMERQARKKMEYDMYYGMKMYPAPQVAPSGSYMYGTDGTCSQPSHTCSVKTNKRHRGYTEGLIEYHRTRGKADVEVLEKVCKEPDCLLARIKKA